MSDQNDTQADEPTGDEEEAPEAPDLSAVPAPTEPPEEAPEEQPEEDARNPYLERAKMLPVDGVVYCLEHTAVHDDTTDPYGHGAPDCEAKEHRTVYYRGRKGDIDETPEHTRIIAKTQAEELSSEERAMVVQLVDHAAAKTEEAAAAMYQIWPEDDLGGIRAKLAMLGSVTAKLGDD